MKAMLFVLVGIGLNSAVHAEIASSISPRTHKTCVGRLNAIVKHPKVAVVITREVSQHSKKALSHFRDHPTQGGAYIASVDAYHDLAHGTIRGHRVSLADGTGASVSYYFDSLGKLI